MSDPDAASPSPLGDIDRMVHEPARLLILGQLYVVAAAEFLFVKQQTGLTQGNLSSHMSKLEAEGYIEVEKDFVDKRPRTMLRLSATGRKAFEAYVSGMQSFLNGVSATADGTAAGSSSEGKP